jgi:hypothetical protein
VAIFRLRFESMTGLCVQLAWQHHQPIDHPHQVERDSDAEQSSDKRPTPQPPCIPTYRAWFVERLSAL